MKKRHLALIVIASLAVGLGVFLWWWTGGSARHIAASPARYEVDERPDLAYTATPADPERQRLDLYLPKGATHAPVAAIWHGGGWTKGDRTLPAVQQLAYWLAERGVIGVAMGYRLAGPISALESARDAAQGVAWLHAHIAEYGGDPRHIYFLGHSAGAELASLVACDRKFLDALGVPAYVPAGVIGLAGPYDLRAGRIGSHPVARQMARDAFHGDEALCAAMSPIAFVHAGLPPFLLIVGLGDRLVPRRQADNMFAALRAVGVKVELLVVPGRTHVSLIQKATGPGDLASEAALRFIQSGS